MDELTVLMKEVRQCKECKDLPLGPRPVFNVDVRARMMVIGQAPGIRVHNTGIPWNDPSGDRLRQWLGMDREQFYDASQVAIMPMGFCYPGTGPSGDFPPRKECAPLWHAKLFGHLPNIKLTLLIGQYAQAYYLGNQRKKNLTETVKAWKSYLPKYLPLPHPSPRNNIWLKRNPWFEKELLPELLETVRGYVQK